jgi:two-component system chemotaxis response regulator CheB
MNKKTGAHYSNGPDWGVYVQTERLLITGQNPTSSTEAAKALMKLLKKLRFQRTHASLLINFRSPMKEKSVSARRLTKPAQGARLELPVTSMRHSFPVIAMAASVGDLKALSIILGGLPADFPAAIAIVMHLSPEHKSILAEILNGRTHLAVKQAYTGDVLRPGSVFVAPPNHHLMVTKGGRLELSSSAAEKVHYARPSAEPLFASVAEIYQKHAIAVVLTGGDGDGSFGVQIIKERGGTVIAQDRPTSQDFSMPETSIKTGDVDFILPLNEIAPKLIELAGVNNGGKPV